MKVGIITFHRAINYGGILQAYALQQVIEKMGHDAEIIDYHCPVIEKQYRPDIWDRFTKKNIKRFIYAILKNGSIKYAVREFENFTEQYMKLSDKIYTPENIGSAEYDVFITGSDQVWSYYCAGFDKAYFLDFVKDAHKKNAYAASFGVDVIPDDLKQTYKKLLYDFENISVREPQGAEIVNGLLNVNPPVVSDPTLLLKRADWEALLPSNSVTEKKYILVYMLETNNNIIKYAVEIAKKENLEVIYITNRFFRQKNVENFSNASPTQWLDLIYNAEYVFTNSFHGIAFSICFGKKMYVQYIRGNNKVNSRIKNILSVYGLEDRLLPENYNAELNKSIDDMLESERSRGYKYIEKILGGKK